MLNAMIEMYKIVKDLVMTFWNMGYSAGFASGQSELMGRLGGFNEVRPDIAVEPEKPEEPKWDG